MPLQGQLARAGGGLEQANQDQQPAYMKALTS